MKKDLSSEKYLHVFEHLTELRKKIFVSLIVYLICLVAAFAIYDYTIEFFTKFYSVIEGVGENKLFVNSIVEGITTRIKVSLLMGLIFSTPVHIYNLVSFVFPALKRKEKRYLSIGLLCSLCLMGLSIYLSYFKILPISINFLTNGGFIPEDVGLLLNYQTSLFYILYFVFWSILAFQGPIVFVLLMAFNLIKRKTALKLSRYIIVVIFIISAVVTPPDVISQLGLALPLVILYFMAILVAKVFKLGE